MKNTMMTLTVMAGIALSGAGAQGAEAAGKGQAKTYPDYPEVARLEIGDAAPDFKLPGVDGKTHTLAEYKKADILAVLFTCNHCPTSRLYEQRVIDMVKRYEKKSFQLVAISPNDPGALRPDEVASAPLGDSFAEMKIRAKEMKYNFPYLYDGETQKVTMAYGAARTPQLFIFDKARKLFYTGAIDENPGGGRGSPYAIIAIDAQLTGRPLAVAMTRSFGCSVKWGYKRQSVDEATAAWNARPVALADLDAKAATTLAKNGENLLRVICLWSLADPAAKAQLGELVMLRRIFEGKPVDIVTVNCDPAAKKDAVLALLKAQHAAAPGPSRFRPPHVKQSPCNYVFTGPDAAKLLAALAKGAKTKADAKDAKATAKPARALIIMPGGDVIFTQTGKLDARILRAKIRKVFEGGE